MDKLTRVELEEMWQICFGQEDAETCFAIDSEYQSRYGLISFLAWVERRCQ